jgi:putative tryptophan/tyrosine transport system substrate-binding protein
MRRRDFITLVGSASLAWPFAAARAQQAGQSVRRVASLSTLPADDPIVRSATTAFTEGLRQLGWDEGRNLHLDFRWGTGDVAGLRASAAELVRSGPDIIFAAGSPALATLKQATQNIPIVFVNVADPVGQGFITNLARPGGNITGFTNFELAMGGKWLNVIKDLAPRAARVALIVNPDNPNASFYLRSIDTVAASFGITTVPTFVRTKPEIENAIPALANASIDGAIVLPDGLAIANRRLIIDLAVRNHVLTVYPFRDFAVDGGLASYGINYAENYRQAAEYIDRILRGANPADLPVQAPSKFELVINVKTAKALGLTIPQPMLLAADEVIE